MAGPLRRGAARRANSLLRRLQAQVAPWARRMRLETPIPSHSACKRYVATKACRMRQEFPSSPHARTRFRFPPPRWRKRKKTVHWTVFLDALVEAAGIEPASASTLQTVLHT
jgi:hypothetical protein